MTDFFRAENLVKRYANHLALNNVSLNLPHGQVFGLLGPNGAGKTTLIRIINQITAPDSGQVFFRGQALRPEHVHQIGYLPEERGLYKKMKVGEQAIYLARLKGLSRAEALKRLRYWFQKFEIADWWDKKVEELSKGMQQKVQFIVTVLHEPELLIFDEPFSGFDPINANLLKREMLELKAKGATIIFSTHNMASVEEVCDHIALINQSEKILEGDIQSIRQAYRSRSYEVVFDKAPNFGCLTMSADYHVLSSENKAGQQHVHLQLISNWDTNTLLTHLMRCGNLVQFAEKLPDMNQIFIQAVQQSNQASK